MSVEKVNSVVKKEESESSSESSSSESEDEEEEEEKSKKSSSSPVRRISITRSNSRINFEPVEALAAQKHAPKPAIEKIKRSLLESRSDSSSSTQDRCDSGNEKKDCGSGKMCAKSGGLLKTPERGGQCSPSIEVTSNLAFVSAQEQR